MKLKKGTKIKMLNNCQFYHFKKDDILIIDSEMIEFPNCYYCEGKTLSGFTIQVDTTSDKFEMLDLKIFNELGD